MLFKRVLIGIFFSVLFILQSCKKKEGCMDKEAENYCHDCKKENGTCTYSALVGYWWNKSFKDSCEAHGISMFVAYWDGVMAGTAGVITTSPNYWANKPGCKSSMMGDPLLFTRNLGKNKTGTIGLSFKMYDINNVLVRTTPEVVITVAASRIEDSTCNLYEVNW